RNPLHDEVGMAGVLEAIVVDHDPRFVLLAASVCAFGMIATLGFQKRALDGRQGALWLALVGLCAGCTVWATHFIAMLGYAEHVSMTYDPVLTALSFVAGG